jgi:hypothetical protein
MTVSRVGLSAGTRIALGGGDSWGSFWIGAAGFKGMTGRLWGSTLGLSCSERGSCCRIHVHLKVSASKPDQLNCSEIFNV